MRIFLSFNSKDMALAEALRAGLRRLEPDADVFLHPLSITAGFWMPKLADNIAQADAFVLLIGPMGIGPWQAIEYYAALERSVEDQRAQRDKRFPLVPVVVAAGELPGLPFLRTLDRIEASAVADDMVHRLLAALRGEGVAAATPLWKLVNPYRGLLAMTDADADYFHGREAETAAVLGALADKPGRIPILVGASGVGKSSVAQAGVLSALKSMHWPGSGRAGRSDWPDGLRDSRSWAYLTIRPGESPVAALAAVFIRLWQLDLTDPRQAALPDEWTQGLLGGRNTLKHLLDSTQERLKRREGEAPARVLIYLDQAEELYTRATPKEAKRFSELIAAALDDPRLSALASLRADYFHHLQADAALFGCYEHVDVPPLDRDGLLEVVTAPARALGVAFEDDAAAGRITDAAAAEPGALPLLSYLMTDMWAGTVARGDAMLRLPSQAIDIGGVLAARADQFLAAKPSEELALRRLLTLRLAVVPPEGEPVRRQANREECSDAEWALAARLAEHPWRLVVMRERGGDNQVIAEVAHEALLRAWPRLVQWLREERDFLVFKGEVERAERRWQKEDRANHALLAGLDLTRAAEWQQQRAADLSSEVGDFVQRSIEADRKEKEWRLQLKERAYRWQQRATIGAAIFVVVMAIFGIFAWQQQGQAERERDSAIAARDQATRAETRAIEERDRATRAETRADAELKKAQVTKSLFLADLAHQRRVAGDAATAMLLALEALPDTAGIARSDLPGPELQLDAARRALRERIVLHTPGPGITAAAFSPDGKRIVSTAGGTMALIWDAEIGTRIDRQLQGHQSDVLDVEFSPDGTRIVTASRDRTARMWDAATGRQIGKALLGHDDAVWAAAFSLDGSRIVTASADMTARLWDAQTGKQIGAPLRGHGDAVASAAFSPDGKRIVTASSDNTARLWDVDTGRQIGDALEGHEAALSSAVFSPDGKRIVTSSADGSARLWDAQTGKPIGEPLRGHTDAVNSVAFSPDSKRIVTASDDRTAQLWDAATGGLIGELFGGHLNKLVTAAFSADGRRVVTASVDGTVRLWDAEADKSGGELLKGLKGTTFEATFSPDGKRIVTASVDGARQWDVETGKQIGGLLAGHARAVRSAAFSPDGKRIVTASSDSTARLWDAESGGQLRALKSTGFGMNSAAFSSDGKRIVTASSDNTARLWDAESGSQLRALKSTGFGMSSAHFSPDGKRIVTTGGKYNVRLWDADSGEQIGTPLTGHSEYVEGAAFSPDGKHIVTASRDKTARIWNAATGDPVGEPLKGHGDQVNSAAFSPDGKRIVTASADKTARLWDAATGIAIGELPGHDGALTSAAFSPDGKRIVTASEDKTVRMWELFSDTQELVASAKANSPRCLTPGQREQFFLPREPPAWCIELEKWPYRAPRWKEWLKDSRDGKNPPLPEMPW